MSTDTAITPLRRQRSRQIPVVGLAAVTIAGLIIDAYVHLDLASRYAPIKTGTISQAGLFRIEAAFAIASALAVLIRPRRWTATLAALVAGSALAALLLYRYSNVGTLGPIPNMYEPVWFTEKLVALWAEIAATAATVALLAILHVHRTPRQ